MSPDFDYNLKSPTGSTCIAVYTYFCSIKTNVDQIPIFSDMEVSDNNSTIPDNLHDQELLGVLNHKG